ncbi:alpha/beta hydrolase fold protein [[Bacillus] selenitireducens MLS10]|uniref:Alpha/beta hydrolase fold protein n=2 Tax=Salisediminibacterium selenitireducens TaxID=85683 RepID=D6XSF7_BACIE|nr:alpha/beta hydrolase fold protein [[Bacillus] selenitireducens MLS10]
MVMMKYETNVERPRGVAVVVHGAGEHHGRYRWLIEQFQAAGFHVVSGDLPGQGKTDGKRGHIKSFDEYIARITSWLIAAKTYKLPVILFGHSMGGLASVRTVVRLEERLKPDMMILSSPCLGLVNQTSKPKEFLARVMNRVKPDLYVTSNVRNGTGTRNREVIRLYDEDPLRVRKITVRWYRELHQSMKAAFTEAASFPDIPLLVSQGGEDLIVDRHEVRKWFDRLPINDKSYKEWPGLYHEVLNEPERADVYLHLAGFIETQLALLIERDPVTQS